MYKKFAFVSLFVLTLFLSASVAQAQVFEKGKTLGSAGLIFNSGATSLALQAEHGVTNALGLGAKISYWGSSGISVISVGALGTYHFAEVLKVKNNALDPYAGLYLAMPFVSGYGESVSGDLYGNLLVGARYLFNNKIGPMAQLNLGLINSRGSALELGVTYKF